jgi:hypothetical protein
MLMTALLGLIINISFAGQSFTIGGPWGPERIAEVYQTKQNTVLTEFYEILESTPINAPTSLLGSKFFSVNGKDLDDIATSCLREVDNWERISCASHKLHDFINKNIYETDCKTFAFSFKDLGPKLKIPGLVVDTEQLEGKYLGDGTRNSHIFNKIIVPSPDGQVFSYILDVGLKPGVLFPKTKQTAERHRVKRDSSSLPTIGYFDKKANVNNCESGLRRLPHNTVIEFLKKL